MANIDRAYVALAFVLLLIGELIGFYMGIGNDMKLLSTHTAFVLPGFVTLAIYGSVFRLWPAMKEGMLAAIQFWLGAIGSVGIAIGSYQFSMTGGIAIVAPASALAIIASLLLLWLFWTRSAA